ncbi:MAG TPA: PBP1A family penicillin-binding protein [Rhizomicrobium sp.]|nr:PBP1A family penicillin-binding protein [Rhizomicrobium sp.]
MPAMSEEWVEQIKARLREWVKAGEPYTQWTARIAAGIAVPLALVYLAPQFLGFFSGRLDPRLDLYAVNRPIAFSFLDAKGNDAGHRGAVVGARLKLEEMPAYVPAAFIAMEDRRFYSHNGVDPVGLTRALLLNLRAGRWVAGGSTISQQTAKIVYTQQERTLSRKLTELVNAAGLEQSLSKKQILELYLNRIYLGSGAYGVDGAARVYFGVSARDMTLAQAAMLATLTRAPSVFSPRRDLLAAQQRATWVLDAMVETGAITPEEAAEARAHPAKVIDRESLDARNYFLDTAADEARRLAGPQASGDLIVYTTLEPQLQETARRALQKTLAKSGKRLRVSEGAVVMMHPDGAVAALIGGNDYTSSVFNRATQARRQPGSAFKPFVYLAALEQGVSPWDWRDDVPVDINGYRPTNFGANEYGSITLVEAMTHSVNTITVNLAQEIGIGRVIATAHRVGITSPLVNNASLALGTSEVTPLELTSAYAVFANGGHAVTPYFVTRVDGAGGTRTYYRRTTPTPRRVIDAQVNRDLLAMMWNVVVYGTGNASRLPGRESGGKTGTTQDSHDAWFVGFTTDYVTGVWVGNDNNSPTRGVTGGTLPSQIWKDVMLTAERNLPVRGLDRSPPQESREQFFLSERDTRFPADGEAMASIRDGLPGFHVQEEEAAEAPPPPRRRGGGLFGWLFGSSDEEPTPPPRERGPE